MTTAEYLSTSTPNAVSQIDLAESKRQTGNQTDITESTHFTRNDMAVITEVAFSNNVTINETIKLPPPNHFSLVVSKVTVYIPHRVIRWPYSYDIDPRRSCLLKLTYSVKTLISHVKYYRDLYLTTDSYCSE